MQLKKLHHFLNVFFFLRPHYCYMYAVINIKNTQNKTMLDRRGDLSLVIWILHGLKSILYYLETRSNITKGLN